MTDKISGFSRSPLDVSQSKAGTPVKTDRAGEGKSAPETPGAGDAVSITAAALTLKRAEASLSAMPEVDAGRVETVRQQVDAGTYHIDPENLADKLVQFERELLQT